MVIAVDFDGTIVEHKYPKIGKEIPFAIQTLKMLQQKDFRIILWTVRHGKELEEALQFCYDRGLEFYAVNKNFPEEKYPTDEVSRKIVADIYIDDRNFGGVPGWGEIYQSLVNEEIDFSRNKRNIISRLFSK